MKNIFLIIICLCVGVATQANAQDKPIVIDKIIGKVDNFYILKSDLEQSYAQYANEAQKPTRCQILQNLFINKLLLAKAEIDSVLVDDKRVDGEMNARMENFIKQYGSEKNLIEALGKSVESLKSEVRQQVKEGLVARKMQETITQNVKITPSEVKKFFNAIPKDSIPYVPTEVEVAHLVRYAKVTRDDKNKIKERLLELRRRAQAGEDFAALAKEFSEDPGSAANGGLYVNVKRGQMVPPFEGAALKTKPGQISDVVESDYGFHIIKTEEIRGQEYTCRHILLRPDYNRLDVTEPTRYLDSLRILILADSIKFEKAAKEYSEDKSSNDAGGTILDPQTGGPRLPLDETMDSYLYLTLDSMKVGFISKPVQYRTEDGKTAMRLIFYKKKYAPHYASIKDDYQKIAAITLARKKNKAIDDWFIKAKAEVFVSVDDEYKDCNVLSSTGSQ